MRVRTLALLLLSAAWPVGASAAAERPPIALSALGEQMSGALEALRTGDWEAAARGFRNESRQASLLSDYADFFLAESLSRLGDLAGARQVAESLGLSGSASRLVPLALLLSASLASREGDEATAERLLRQFLSRFSESPDGARARYLLGLALEAQGRGAEAASAFRDLWLFAPSSPYAEAADDRLAGLAGRGIALPPLTHEERLERAERLLTNGAPAASREEAETVLAERPAAEQALRALTLVAESLRRLRRYGEAARAVENALSLAPPRRRPVLLLELGWLQHRTGAWQPALGTLERLIRQFPREPEVAQALVLKGRTLEEARRLSEAIGAYQRAAAEFPGHEASAGALWRLGWLAHLRADLAGAARQFGKLVDHPVGLAYRLGAAYWAGRSRETLGEHGAAQRFFRLVVTEAPRSYYGILAAARVRAITEASPKALPVTLPSDALAPLAGELRFAKAEALRTLGLIDHANAELEELSAGILADAPKLYALSALWAREEQYHLALRILRRHFADLARSGHPGLPLRFWELFYPLSWKRELREAAERAGLDRHLVAAVVREESSFSPQARSRAGARGLMQLMPGTARPMVLRRGLALGAGELLEEPRLNLELGAEFLAKLLREFGDPRLAVAAYNAGPVRVREWWQARRSDDLEAFVEQIPFDETRYFVKRVLLSWEEYRRIYGASW